MAFHEHWFARPKQQRLSEALDLVPEGRGELVEVGSWEGRSSILIAKKFPHDKLHVIDHWRGDLTNLSSGVAEIAASRDVYADFEQNIFEADVAGQIVVHRAGWREVFENWQLPIRMIFIDGEHTFREVDDNIRAVLPFMVSGGLICGDDFTVPGVGKAVSSAFGSDVIRHGGPGAAIWWHVHA